MDAVAGHKHRKHKHNRKRPLHDGDGDGEVINVDGRISGAVVGAGCVKNDTIAGRASSGRALRGGQGHGNENETRVRRGTGGRSDVPWLVIWTCTMILPYIYLNKCHNHYAERLEILEHFKSTVAVVH